MKNQQVISRHVEVKDFPLRKDSPEERSEIQPIPYFPNLKIELRSVTACIVMAYLEIHHPAPEPENGTSAGLASLPVRLDLDAACKDLGISRRTLYRTLSVLSSRWKNEEARGRAAHANREFLVPSHSRHGPIAPYSLTGPLSYAPGATQTLRRNRLLVQRMLKTGTFSANPGMADLVVKDIDGLGASPSTAHTYPERESLGDIMLRASVLAGDRRSERYPRLRRAIERGLAGPEVLQVKPKRSS